MIDICYEIVRSPKRKTLTITVERDRAITVHAPEGTSDSEIQRLVDAKRQWILAKLRHLQKYQERLHPPGKEVVNGESAPYLGRDYRIEITKTLSGEIEFSSLFLIPPTHQAKRRKVLRDWYIARAREKILARAEEHAHALGVKFVAAKIVDNRYRWGSCTVKDNVSFNWRLIKAPMFVTMPAQPVDDVKSFCRSFKLLTGPFVQLTCHLVQMRLRVHRQVRSLGEVLSE